VLAVVLGGAMVAAGPVAAPTSAPATTAPVYEYRTASRDGIGKVYMGREIAHVMGHLGAEWLERPEREQEERPALLMRALDLKADDVVADIGAGSGYFSFRMAKRVPRGKVVAVDIQPEMLEMVEKRAAAEGVKNVETVLGTVSSPGLAESSIDVALMVDAYHEFDHPREMMEGIVSALKPGGRVILVEYRGEDPAVPIKALHKMTEAQVVREMGAVGLKHVETKESLPRQHVLIFAKGR
jgi:FkbM family methyltransferase